MGSFECHCPLTKQCSINLGSAKNRTQGRWEWSKNVIHYAMVPPLCHTSYQVERLKEVQPIQLGKKSIKQKSYLIEMSTLISNQNKSPKLKSFVGFPFRVLIWLDAVLSQRWKKSFLIRSNKEKANVKSKVQIFQLFRNRCSVCHAGPPTNVIKID